MQPAIFLKLEDEQGSQSFPKAVTMMEAMTFVDSVQRIVTWTYNDSGTLRTTQSTIYKIYACAS